jgi:hypothetical protein
MSSSANADRTLVDPPEWIRPWNASEFSIVRLDSVDSEILRMSKEFRNGFHAVAKECNLQFRLFDLKLIVETVL